jgi:P27 family predicted phage terminase small subunit
MGTKRRQKDHEPPKHLSAEARQWWANVVEAFELEPHHLKVLRLACEAWDRAQEARKALTKHGTTFIDRFEQPRVRPEVAIERAAWIAFARLVRELGLDAAPDDSRPPGLSNRYRWRR